MNRHENSAPPTAILAAYALDPRSLAALDAGLINRTWSAVTTNGQRRILQRVNPLFGEATQHDIMAVTAHIASLGQPTTTIVRASDGSPYVKHREQLYRVLTYVEGISLAHVAEPKLAGEAGRVLAEFHRALASFPGQLSQTRPNIHVLSRHLAKLEEAMASATRHPAHHDVARLAKRVARTARRLPSLDPGPVVRVHGDPKITNVLFDPTLERAICLIDLDTLTEMPVLLELGDALRSWCNPVAEDSSESRFEPELFDAACRGYLAAGFEPPRRVWPGVAVATATIAVELAARFCADAVNESYFRWDSARYASASEHNQARTIGQLRVAAAILDRLDELAAIARAGLA